MSEYQYYAFAAVDGPISDEGMQYAEDCSTRAHVTRFRWYNEYSYGDFHGSVETLLKYYDAHFYISNWGTVRFALAFPENCLDWNVLQSLLQGDVYHEERLSIQNIEGRRIVSWDRNEEGASEWAEGEGVIDGLIGIREELLGGDYRALFLGWLAGFDADDWLDLEDSGALIPPVPPGLDCLTLSLRTLIEQFPVDSDALTVASGQSQAAMPDRIPVSTVLDKLPVPELKAMLQRVADGDGPRVMSLLNRLTYPPNEAPTDSDQSCVDFAAKVIKVREARLQDEAKAAAAERERAATAHKRHLESIMNQVDTIWAGLAPLMDQKIASAYDNVAAQLHELRDAYRQADKDTEFRKAIATFRNRYQRSAAMMRRIKDL